MSNRTARSLERAEKAKATRQRQLIWVGVACVIVVAAGFGLSILLNSDRYAPGPPEESAEANTPDDAALRTLLDEGGTPAAESEAAQALETIEEHRTKLEADPDAPDAPGLLNAMASLYRHKRNDYRRAAQCYEDILADYPDWEGIVGVFPQLVACYDRMGNTEYLDWTYRRMMEYYPEDSQEYLYAKSELGL